MAFAQDYVSVAERVAEFYERYPEGGIQTEIVTHTDSLVVVKAYAYRNAADPFPGGVGHSQLNIPGTTNFTRGSEVENCETSAVGRALAFLGFAAKDGIASREEVANKRESSPPAGEGSGGRTQTNPSPAQTIISIISKGVPAWAKDDKPLRREAIAAALGCKPSELNNEILPDYIGAWLNQSGNNSRVFEARYLAFFKDEHARREANEAQKEEAMA